MIGTHITESILDACEEGTVSAEALLRHLLRHLQSHCDSCHEEIETWRRRKSSTASGGLLQVLLEERSPRKTDPEKAAKDLAALLPLNVADRERKVRRAISRYRSPLLARSLVQESIGELGYDLEEATHLLDLAFSVLEQGTPSTFSREVRAHALAVRATIWKNRGELNKAAEGFEEARLRAPRKGLADLVLAGELDEMEGSFLKDRRQLGQAETLLQRAIRYYHILQDVGRQARALLLLAHVKYYRGRIDDAIRDASTVLELVPDHKSHRLIADHNLTLYLVEAGRPEEAARRLKQNQARYQETLPGWRLYDLHFHWLAGKITHGLGRYEQAEMHLVKARDGFVERGTAYDAILVCLDLALVYDVTGRTDEVLRLTRLISGELARESLHEESMAAVALFLKAAAKQNLTDDFVRKVSHFLQFSRTDPSLKHELIHRE